MKFITSRALAAVVAASCLAIPTSASAMPYSPPSTTESEAVQSGSEPTTDRTDTSAISGVAPARANGEPQSAAGLAQERYYSSYGKPGTIDGGTSAAQAQERYYSSYGKPEPLTVAQSPAHADDTPWLTIALSVAVALGIVAASATQVRRLRIRRRVTRVTT